MRQGGFPDCPKSENSHLAVHKGGLFARHRSSQIQPQQDIDAPDLLTFERSTVKKSRKTSENTHRKQDYLAKIEVFEVSCSSPQKVGFVHNDKPPSKRRTNNDDERLKAYFIMVATHRCILKYSRNMIDWLWKIGWKRSCQIQPTKQEA